MAIGNIHLLTFDLAPVDLAHLARIHARVSIPLVIHGGTSFPPAAVPAAISYGAAKFNVGTILKKAFLEGVLDAASGFDAGVTVHDVLGSHTDTDILIAGKRRMREKVRAFLRVYGSSGHASDFSDF